uniref:Cytosolic thiouridylase subunit 1 n=1 Tax=Strix occidentalis caurina TaxID=311401 RepID=A0A8D0FA68_STROC
MPAPRCRRCPLPASLRRPRTGDPLCRRCFVAAFEDEAHRPGQTVAVAASGGKDSTVLAHLLRRLQRRRGCGYRLALLSVDEGIAGYREAALGAVKRARGDLPLLVVSHRELFGWSVDEVAAGLGSGSRCTFCGVWRRQALERGARLLGVDWIATGEDWEGTGRGLERVRGDWEGLGGDWSGFEGTGRDWEGTGAGSRGLGGDWTRCKPLRHAYEKEIVLYAYFQGLDYVSTECVYAPHAYRGHARSLLKDLEATRASTVAALGHSGRRLAVATEVATKTLGACKRCGFAASQPLCKACVLLASLERGLPRGHGAGGRRGTSELGEAGSCCGATKCCR